MSTGLLAVARRRLATAPRGPTLEWPAMSAAEHLLAADLILAEGSLYERLRREPAVAVDAQTAPAGFVYAAPARDVLERTHREYLDIGQAHRLPMLTVTDTWRANRARQDRSDFRDLPVNQENVRFL